MTRHARKTRGRTAVEMLVNMVEAVVWRVTAHTVSHTLAQQRCSEAVEERATGSCCNVYRRPDHRTPWYPAMPVSTISASTWKIPTRKPPGGCTPKQTHHQRVLEIRGRPRRHRKQGIRTTVATTLAVVAKRVADTSNAPEQAHGGSHVRLWCVCEKGARWGRARGGWSQ